MNQNKNIFSEASTRRTFFQSAFVFMGIATLLNHKVFAEGRGGAKKADASSSPTLVDPNSSEAKAVSYKHLNSEVTDKAMAMERQGVKFKDQKCSGCALYQKETETTVGGKKAGKCLAPFATGKYVAADGWCSTWAKKG